MRQPPRSRKARCLAGAPRSSAKNGGSIAGCLLLIAFATPGWSAVPPETAGTRRPQESELLLRVYINREDKQETALFLKREGNILAAGTDLERWRLRWSASAPVHHDGTAYFELSSVKGLSYRVEEATQTLWIEAGPDVFEATSQSFQDANRPQPVKASLGGFVNYNLFGQGTASRAQFNALTEFGVFSRWGVGTNQLLGRDLGKASQFIRLDTTWNMDLPDQLSTFRFGDTITRTGSWGRAVRVGGAQWATNFATQPGFITFPLPSLKGEAALPSTADLFLNNTLIRGIQLAPGPFSITNIPVLSGQGEIQLVTQDLLGREHVITQPYYAGPNLLRKGLQDFSYELGFIRENFGFASNDYGRALAMGTHRLGFTDQFTGEAHAELFQDQQTLGFGGAWLWDRLGVFNAAAAGSHQEQGTGGLIQFGFQRQAINLSFGGLVQLTSRDFTQAGLAASQPAPAILGEAHVGLPLNSWGFVNLGYIRQNYRDRQGINAMTASYNLTLGDWGFLSLSAFLPVDGTGNTTFLLGFTRALGERTTGSITHTTSAGYDQTELRLQRNLPVGTGVGYRLAAGIGTSERFEGGISLQNQIGTYALDVTHYQNENIIRGQAAGGFAVMRNKVFLSREITDSFGIVQVGHYPDVRIYAFNQPVAKTDRDGMALIPRLLPYQNNPIRVEEADLPLNARIDALQLDAVPYFRSGILLDFPIKPLDGVVLEITLENGQAMPAGATVRVVGAEQEFPVGLRGQAYVTGLTQQNRLRATWRGQSCEFPVQAPDRQDPLPNLGTHLCTGVQP